AKIAGQRTVGVVEEDIRFGTGGQRRGAALRRRYVGCDSGDFDIARGADLGRSALQGVTAARDDGHVHTLARDGERAGAAEPAAGAAQQSAPVADAELHGCPPHTLRMCCTLGGNISAIVTRRWATPCSSAKVRNASSVLRLGSTP